ncbi:MAG TPA: MFS transporter [Acidimicrobiales bacterium]|nr:MFS transporter [Acidimicrobiales bacterium]
MSSDQPTSRRRGWWTLAVLILIQATLALNAAVIVFASPSASYDLHFSSSGVQWLVTTFALGFGSLLVLGGELSDRWGRRTTLYVGLGGFLVASMLAGSATGYTWLVSAVALQGVFSALLTPTILAMLSALFVDQNYRAKGFAAYGTIAGAGIALALFVGGLLLYWTSWRWCFYQSAVLAALALTGVANFVKDRDQTARPLDSRGVALVTGGLLLVIYALAHAVASSIALFQVLGWSISTTSRWRNVFTWGPLVAGAGLLALAVRRPRSRHFLLPARLLKSRPLVGSVVALVLASAATVQVLLMLADYLRENLGGSPAQVGVDFLPLLLTTLLTSYFASARLLASTGPRPLIPTGMILSAMGMVLFTRLTIFPDYWGHVFPGLILLGLGLGLIFAPAFASAMSSLEHSVLGAALVTTATWLGGAVGVAILSTVAARVSLRSVVAARSSEGVDQEIGTVHGLSVVFWWSACAFIIGAVLTFFLLRPGPTTSVNAAPAIQISGQG